MGIELADGGTVGNILKHFKKSEKSMNFKDEECASIMTGILQGIKHLHAFDYVHRDLKPSNVVISDMKGLMDTSNIKLVDFGLAVKYEAV